jgi:hypothetical protein
MTHITHRIVDRRITMLVFERGPHKRPTSSLQLSRMGDNAIIDSLMGPGFYRLLEKVGLQPFEEMGIRHVYAAVTDVHLCLLADRMPLVDVTVIRPTVVDGIPMNWVEIKGSGRLGVEAGESGFATL